MNFGNHGVLQSTPHGYQGRTEVLGESEVIHGFSIVQGLVPLSPELFKGKL